MTYYNTGYAVKHFGGQTKRYCQTLDLRNNPELITEYRRLHSKEGVWPEILEGIRKAGILEMEIYIKGCHLFMIVEMPAHLDWNDTMKRMGSYPRQAEWEALTSRFQNTSGGSSEDKWNMMERIFHLYDK